MSGENPQRPRWLISWAPGGIVATPSRDTHWLAVTGTNRLILDTMSCRQIPWKCAQWLFKELFGGLWIFFGRSVSSGNVATHDYNHHGRERRRVSQSNWWWLVRPLHCHTRTIARLHACIAKGIVSTLHILDVEPRAPVQEQVWDRERDASESLLHNRTWIHLNPVATLPSNPAKTTRVHHRREISTHTQSTSVQWNCPTVPQVTSMLHSPLLSQQTPSLGGRLVTLGRWDGWGEARVLNGAVGSGWKAEVWETWVSGSGLLGLSCCATSGSERRLTDWKRKETSRAPSMPVYFRLFIWFHLPQPSGIFLG